MITKTKNVSYCDIARFIWHYWRRQKIALFLIMAGLGMAATLDAFFPVLTGYLITTITEAGTGERAWTSGLVIAFLAFIGLEVAYHSIRGVSHFYWAGFAVRNLNQIVTDQFQKVQRFSTDWHANAFAGATVRKITRGMWAFDRVEDILLINLLPTIAVMIMTIIIMTLHWPLMGLITFLMSVLYIAVSIYTVLRINAPRFRKSAAHDTEVGASIADAITGNATVKSFGQERFEDHRFGGVVTKWRVVSLNAWRWGVGMDYIRRWMSVLMMVAMLTTAIHLWTLGQAGTGDIVYVFTAYLVLSNYLKGVGEQVANLLKSVSEMEDAVIFWKREDEIRDISGAKAFVPTVGGIVFDRVRFMYESQRHAIYDDFSLTINPGEQVALVGHSGSGKSTFVKLIQRLYDVSGGEIRIDGQNIAHVTQESLRRAISLVPQEPVLFHRSLLENIAYGRPDATEEEVIEAAKRAYAHEFIERLPLGYKTLVGERGIKLSGGERQRVAIARAILADTPILILDEATSSLDSVSEHYIQKALKNLMDGKTVITVAHRLATIKNVDRILVFDQGQVLEQGAHAKLIKDSSSHYKRLYDMQALDLVG